MFSFLKKKDPALKIGEELIKKDFLRTVNHYVTFAPAPGKIPLNFAILPLHEGILTSIALEDFTTAQDETDRIIFTHVNKTAQIIVDYAAGLMTVTFGYVLLDTFEAPQHAARTDYHG